MKASININGISVDLEGTVEEVTRSIKILTMGASHCSPAPKEIPATEIMPAVIKHPLIDWPPVIDRPFSTETHFYD